MFANPMKQSYIVVTSRVYQHLSLDLNYVTMVNNQKHSPLLRLRGAQHTLAG